jgi:hypothetical protein
MMIIAARCGPPIVGLKAVGGPIFKTDWIFEMFSITENKPPSEVQITTSTRIDWPDRKDLPTSGEFNS